MNVSEQRTRVQEELNALLSETAEEGYDDIIAVYSGKYPELNIFKMIKEYIYGQKHSCDHWCRCGIGKRYRNNGTFEFICGEGKECKCTVLLHTIPDETNEE